MIMKENQNAALVGSKSSRRDTDEPTFGSKETCELNYSRMDPRPLASEAKDRDEHLNCKVMDEFAMDNENGTTDSPRKEGQSELSHHLSSWDKDADSLSSDSYDIDKECRSPVHENSVRVEDFADCNGSDSGDSSTLRNCATDPFERERNLFTDKNVLECELPELEVCYKDDCQILRDICVDEGSPEKDINMIEICKDGKLEHLFPQPPNHNDHFEATEDSKLEHANGLSASQCGSKEENDGKKELVSERRLESSSDNSSENDTAKHSNPGDSVLTGEANRGATGKAKTDLSEEHSLVDGELPVEEFGTQSFFRSFLDSLDGEGNNGTQLPDQILSGKSVSESPDAASAEAGATHEDVQGTSLLYNSKVENRSITFNFKPPVSIVLGNGTTKSVEEQSADSVDKDGNYDGGSATSHAQCVKNKDCSGENAREHKDTNSDDSSTDGQLQFPSDKSPSSTDDIEQNVPKHERRNSGNASVVSQLQHDEGETSFSAASLITYSGPIAFSGSLSHRSDGSATSVKSFAFPVLQSEWNSSPVRMAKADRRHFKKHKGWRSGLLCCRF